jgi:hypothetical protein
MQTFDKVWGTLTEEWDWPVLSEYERQNYFGYSVDFRGPYDKIFIPTSDAGIYKSFVITLVDILSKNEFILPPGVHCLKAYRGKTGETYEIDLSYTFRILAACRREKQ